MFSHKKNIFFIVRNFHFNQTVIFSQCDRRKSFLSHIAVLSQRSLFNQTIFCRHKQIQAVIISSNRNHRCYFFFRHKLQEKNDKIDQTRDRILREANEKARDILREAKDTADETIRIFQKAGPGASMKDLEQARQKLRSNIDDKNSKLSVAAKDKPKAPALKPEQLKKGDAVRIVSMGLKGTVSSLPDAKGNLFVQCGIMRTSTNIKDLVRIEEATITTPTMSKTNTGKLRMSKSFSVSPEINLLGKTVDEALAALDKYLDDAYLAHLENVRVVHGKGTGALRKAIQQHLKRIKYVKSFRQGEYGEGDAGVTIVEFKK